MLSEVEAGAEGLLTEGRLEQPFMSSHTPMATLGGISRTGEVVMLTKMHSSRVGFLIGIQGRLSISKRPNMGITVIRDTPVNIRGGGGMRHPQDWAEGVHGKHRIALVVGEEGEGHSNIYCSV